MDLSPAFQKGAKELLPNAQVIFDRFHLMKFVNEAVDAVRKGEVLS
jgi:transposase